MKLIGSHLMSLLMGLLGGACSSVLLTSGQAQESTDSAADAQSGGTSDVLRTRRLEIVSSDDRVLGVFEVTEDSYWRSATVLLSLGRTIETAADERPEHSFDGVSIGYTSHSNPEGEWVKGSSILHLADSNTYRDIQVTPDLVSLRDWSFLIDKERGKQNRVEITSTDMEWYKSSSRMIHLGYIDPGFTKDATFNGLVLKDANSTDRIKLRTLDWDIESPELRFLPTPGRATEHVYPPKE